MSRSRLLISIAVLTALFVAGKMMFQRDPLPSRVERTAVQPAMDHGGGIASGSNERLRHSRADRAKVRENVARIDALEREVVRLEDELAALGAALRERTQQGAYVAGAALESPAAGQHPPPDEADSADDADFRALASAFASDPIDPQWATTTSALVTDFFEGDNAGAAILRDVDCRSTYCRVTVGQEDRMAADEMAIRFGMHVAPALPQISYHYDHQSDGYTEVTMYLARSGEALPSEG